MNRCFAALFALLLPITAAPGRAIPPPPPDDVRIVRVLDGNTILVMPYGSPFRVRRAPPMGLRRRSGHAQAALREPGSGLRPQGRAASGVGHGEARRVLAQAPGVAVDGAG
jgi:hypothetical protein